METVKRITNKQVKDIAIIVSTRFKFENNKLYYNCIDIKTGQRSNDGGDKNFASYNFNNLVECEFLKLIENDPSYFDWSKYGVDLTNARKCYMYKLQYKIIELLCGYKDETIMNTLENKVSQYYSN